MDWNIEKAGEFEHLNKLEEGVFSEIIGPVSDVREIPKEEVYLFGDVESGKIGWRYQGRVELEGLASCCMVLEQLTGEKMEESYFSADIESLGYSYDADCGLSFTDLNDLLKNQGMIAELQENLTMKDIMENLESDGKMLCPVNTWILQDTESANVRGIIANGIVELIALDASDPADVKIYYNSVSDKNGCGKGCGWLAFQDAWKAAGKSAIYIGRGLV